MTEFEQAIAQYAQDMEVSKTEAKEDAERTIAQWMTKNNWTREFAECSWIEETLDDEARAKMNEMEAKAKANGTAKVQAKSVNAYGKKCVREHKKNEEKFNLIAEMASRLEDFHHLEEENPASGVENVEIVNAEREITFNIGENHYSWTLTQHRKPKK